MTTSGTANFAYVHCRPDGSVFYVGAGTQKRARTKSAVDRNVYYNREVEAFGRENVLIGSLECSSKDIALELERGIIKCLRRQGVVLANATDGGKKGTVLILDEAREKLSAAAKERGMSDVCRAASVASRKGKPLSLEQRKKQSESMKGIVFSDEHRKNISESAKKRGMSEAVLSAAHNAIKKKVIGSHPDFGVMEFESAKAVALFLGKPLSSTAKKVKAEAPYCGWIFRYSYDN